MLIERKNGTRREKIQPRKFKSTTTIVASRETSRDVARSAVRRRLRIVTGREKRCFDNFHLGPHALLLRRPLQPKNDAMRDDERRQQSVERHGEQQNQNENNETGAK